MNGSILALTVTSEDIKLIEITQENGEKLIRGMYHHQLDENKPATATDVITKIIQEEKPKTLKTFLVINSQDLDYRVFSFPFDSPKKVSKAIRFEVSSEYSPDNHVISHIASAPKEPGMKSFVAAITRKDVLRRRIKESEDAGLQIVGITSDLSTLGNYFGDENEALVMEMGERQILFALYAHGLPILTRDIPIGARQIVRNSEGLDDNPMRLLIGEIKRTVHSFNAKTGLDLKRVHVSGNIFLHLEMFGVLKEALALEFIDQPPLKRAFTINGDKGDPNVFASLLGAAEWKRKNRSFNFFKDEFFKEHPAAIQQTFLRWGFIVLLSFLFTITLSLWLNISLLEKRKDFLTTEIRRTFQAAFPQTKRIVDEVRQARNFLDARRSEFGDSNLFSGPPVLDILEIISRAVPVETDFEINSLFLEKGKLEINGKTDSFTTVNIIQELLSGRREFSNVTISNAKTKDEGQNVEFKITIHLAG